MALARVIFTFLVVAGVRDFCSPLINTVQFCPIRAIPEPSALAGAVQFGRDGRSLICGSVHGRGWRPTCRSGRQRNFLTGECLVLASFAGALARAPAGSIPTALLSLRPSLGVSPLFCSWQEHVCCWAFTGSVCIVLGLLPSRIIWRWVLQHSKGLLLALWHSQAPCLWPLPVHCNRPSALAIALYATFLVVVYVEVYLLES